MDPKARYVAIVVKGIGLLMGVVLILLSLGYAFDELTYLEGASTLLVGDVITFLAIVGLGLAGTALVAQLPESLRVRFRKLPQVSRRRPVYGFGTMLAVGVGATLGSPLFILIPLNVEEYEVVSLLSLLLATIFSVAMAKVYSDLGRESKLLGADLVGSPSFAKAASGAGSLRYFVSRVSMWVANTALAAYTTIVFLIFDFVFLPKVLANYGFGPTTVEVVTWGVAIFLVGWTVVNVFFEQRYLRALGVIQVVLTTLLVFALIYHSEALGSVGGWDFSGFLNIPGGAGWVPALVINTGYLYLLFFGFQEIQVLERDAVENSSVPVLSWLRKGLRVGKTTYFEAAMILSVLIASGVNVLYGLAVYSAGHGVPNLQSACSVSTCIPALFIAQRVLGSGQELLIAGAFLVATITTFVPAFLAASRHLGALGEDGYMPSSLANLSWLFTIVAISLLAIGDQNFLVEITDVMVLISLGIIALSSFGLRRLGGKPMGSRGLSLVVGLSCFLFGGAVYFAPGGGYVVVFGSVALMFAYLIFDIIELGSLGSQLFFAVFGLICVFALSVFDHTIYASGVLLGLTKGIGVDPNTALVVGLFVSSILLASNVLLDVRLLDRTSVR